jgi:hypothetical protein
LVAGHLLRRDYRAEVTMEAKIPPGVLMGGNHIRRLEGEVRMDNWEARRDFVSER